MRSWQGAYQLLRYEHESWRVAFGEEKWRFGEQGFHLVVVVLPDGLSDE
jgi:hypothetical protein